jgi:hypothetical protein
MMVIGMVVLVIMLVVRSCEHYANVQIRWAPAGHMGQDNSWWDMSYLN